MVREYLNIFSHFFFILKTFYLKKLTSNLYIPLGGWSIMRIIYWKMLGFLRLEYVFERHFSRICSIRVFRPNLSVFVKLEKRAIGRSWFVAPNDGWQPRKHWESMTTFKPVLHGHVFHDRFSVTGRPCRMPARFPRRATSEALELGASTWRAKQAAQVFDARASKTRHVFHVAILHGRVSLLKSWHCQLFNVDWISTFNVD